MVLLLPTFVEATNPTDNLVHGFLGSDAKQVFVLSWPDVAACNLEGSVLTGSGNPEVGYSKGKDYVIWMCISLLKGQNL